MPRPDPESSQSTRPPSKGLWEKYWPRTVSIVQAVMATVLGLNEGFNDGRPYVLAFSLLLFAGAPASEAMIRLLLRK